MKAPVLLRLPAALLFWSACMLFACCQAATLLAAMTVGFFGRCAGYDPPKGQDEKAAR